MKETIRNFALELGVDDLGFAAATDYFSPKSPQLETLFPGVKSIIVLVYRELSSCESPNMQIAMNGRLDVMEFSRSCNYKLARFLEKTFKAKAMTVGASYPLEMSYATNGCIADVSLRHAAVAAGLGSFGRHNLVIHPKFGTRVIFSAVLSNLDLTSDTKTDNNPCTHCNICVQNCPVNALEVEGQTNVSKCLRNSQPYGLGANIKFWTTFVDSTAEEQRKLVKDEQFWRMYQAGFIGFQYFCFNCLKSCPVNQNT